jgi:magnesium transporter
MHAYIRELERVRRTESVDEIKAQKSAGTPCWVVLGDRSPESEALLRDAFGIHHLVIDDIWSTRQLPKVVEYDHYLQIVAHCVAPEKPEPLSELDILLAESFVITHAHGACGEIEEARITRLLLRGTPWIAHALLDGIVDDHVPVIDAFDESISKLEADVIKNAGTPRGAPLVAQIFAMKRNLHALRRTSVHQREMLLRLSRGEFPEIAADAAPYFRDVYDHFARVSDLAESHREHLTSILEGYWSVQSNRMNEIMKTLTLMSTVMLPLTFVAGLYGMNFEHMPELHWAYGYPFALGLMLVIGTAIVAWFRYRKWT